MEQQWTEMSGVSATYPTAGPSGVFRAATSPRTGGMSLAGVDQLSTTGAVCLQGQRAVPARLRTVADPMVTGIALAADASEQQGTTASFAGRIAGRIDGRIDGAPQVKPVAGANAPRPTAFPHLDVRFVPPVPGPTFGRPPV